MKELFVQQLGRLVGLKRRFQAAKAATLAALATAVLAGTAALADCVFILPPSFRAGALMFLAAAALTLLVLHLLRPVLGFRQKQAAQALEAANPGVGQLLRTALELADPQSGVAPHNPVLARQLLNQAAQKLAAIDTAPVAPWRALRTAAVTATALLALLAAAAAGSRDFRTAFARLVRPAAPITFTVVEADASADAAFKGTRVTVTAKLSGRIPPVAKLLLEQGGAPAAVDTVAMLRTGTDTFSATFDMPPYSLKATVAAGDGCSRVLPIRYVLPLRIGATSATITPPAYTRLPATAVKPADTIRAPQGSTILFEATLSNPIREAILLPAAGNAVPTALSFNTLSATFPMPAKPGTFRIRAKDTDGQDLLSPEFRLDPVPDSPPAVTLITPAAAVEATCLEEIPVRVRFKDNYGLRSAAILLVVDGKEHVLDSREFTADAKTREVTLDATLFLEQYELTVNSNVKLYAAATDHNPQARGRAVSLPLAIDIKQLQTLQKKPEKKKEEEEQKQEEQQQQQQQLMELEEIIRNQREINAQTFVAAELDDPDAGADTGTKLAIRQDKLREEAAKLMESLQAKAPENAELVDDATKEMQQASAKLAAHSLREAITPEDAALTLLLKTRQELVKQAQEKKKQQQQQQQKQQKQEENQQPADLASRLDQLAQEEAAIRRALPDTAVRLQLPARQEKINVTLSELREDLLRNKEMTDLVKQRAGELLETVDAAKAALEGLARNPGTDRQAAADQAVETARLRIAELAAHIRALDPNNLPNALKDASDMAKDLSNQLDQKNQQQKQDQGKKPSSQNQQQGQKPPQGQQPQQGGQPGQSEQQDQQAQREAQTLADLLNKAPDMARESDPDLAKRLEEIHDKFNPNAIPQDLADALKDADPKAREELSKLLDELSKRVGEEHQRAATGMLDRLNQAEKEAGDLKKEAEKSGQKPEGQTPGGTQPGSTGDGKGKELSPEERMAKLARELQSLPDQKLKELGSQLGQQPAAGGGESEYKPGQGGVLPATLLAQIQQRLRTRIAEELKKNILRTQDHPVPPEYRRLVEQYFKALSDDIEE